MRHLLSTCLLVGGTFVATGAIADTEPVAGFAACVECHQEIADALASTPHGKSFAHDAEYRSASCASCHPGSEAHAESGDPGDLRTPEEAGAEIVNAACAACHENRREHALWSGSEHETAGVSCADCHSVHRERPVRHGVEIADTNALCLSCHGGNRKDLHLRSRHPLAEGKMDCASCHDPHGAVNEHLVRRDSVNDLCWSCHQELRGPFLWEHSPVREDCLTCHDAHGSNQERMLVTRIAQLCQSCHIQGRHQSIAGSERAIWNSNRSCVNCHPQVHGTNHPSGPLFQR